METTAPRILIIDDNDANIALTTFVLESAGFSVHAVTDAALSQAATAAFRPDLILMDIRLPGGDGLRMTRALRSQASTRDIVIVAYTAWAMKGDESRFLAAGCDAYIPKPIDVAHFAEQVTRILAAGRSSGHGGG
jgi:two-component system, cell cycle response regulator DivK